jgi:phosphopantetheinyl transferase
VKAPPEWTVLYVRVPPDQQELAARSLPRVTDEAIGEPPTGPTPARGASLSVSRYLLRQLLIEATGDQALDLRLERSPNGKPRARGLGWYFNLSHSRGAFMAAVSRRPIGVDLEARAFWHEGVARRVLGPDRAATLRDLPGEDRAQALTEAWVAREACVKTLGGRLSDVPRIDLAPGRGGTWGTVRWALLPIPMSALALVGGGGRGELRIGKLDLDQKPAVLTIERICSLNV